MIFDNLKRVLAEHPFFSLLSAAIALISSTSFITKLYLQDRLDAKVEEYKNDFSLIGRRYNSVFFIDIGKIEINKDSLNKIGLSSTYHARGNFYSANSSYWVYKYTSPIELMLIQNYELVPKSFVNNPVDFPIHAWLGKEKYLVTDKNWRKPDRPELDTTNSYFAEIGSGDTVAIFHSDPMLFQTKITLSSLKRTKNSFTIRDYDNFKTNRYSIDFSDVSKDEILGHYLSTYLKNYFLNNIPVKNVSRRVLSIIKEKDIIYSSFLTEYDSLEINHVRLDKFFLWKEHIIYCDDKSIYMIEMEIPSDQPIKRGKQFEQVNLWFKDFGIPEE